MALRNIFKEGSDCLYKPSRKIEKFDEKLHSLLDDMKDTMRHADGVGLAAPQVGILRKVAIIEVGDLYLEMINPQITEKSGEQIDIEGCLSVSPDKNCKVNRAKKVKVVAYDRNGKKYTKELEDLAARACQHELDHLEGILFFTKKFEENE